MAVQKINPTELTTLRKSGKSIKDLATHYNLSQAMMKRAMKDAGVSTSIKGIRRNKYVLANQENNTTTNNAE